MKTNLPQNSDKVQAISSLPPVAITLLEQACLSMLSDLPTTYEEQNRRLWQAFRLGEQYEKQGGEKALKEVIL